MKALVAIVSLTLVLAFLWILFSRPDPEKSKQIHLSDSVKDLASDPSRRSEAVEACRQESGASKAEARLAVELFVASALSEGVKEITAQPGRKVDAIKLLREKTGVSLMAAKMAVEKWMEDQRSAIDQIQ
jgi:hypothetical protein